MTKQRFSAAVASRSTFVVLAELVGGGSFSFKPIDAFLKGYKDDPAGLPAGFELVGITSPQSPGGVANIEPASVLAHVQAANLLGDLDFIPHVTCKDFNLEGIVSNIMALRALGVQSILALTGDKPVKAKGVFELESVGLQKLLHTMNQDQYLKASAGKLDNIPQFAIGAAVSPFKYTEASQMQQYYKMEKKIAAGASFLITQVGWDWRKSAELFQYLKSKNASVPVIGNVYLLSTISPAPRLMHDHKLPGCFVSDALLQKVNEEGLDEHLERAAQQVAMYKALGAAGVDVGGLPDYAALRKIIVRAAAIGKNWEAYKANLSWPAEKAFYLYDTNNRQVTLSAPGKTGAQKFYDFTHRALLDRAHTGFHALKGFCSMTGIAKGKGCAYRMFNAWEKSAKYQLFDCEECGDCFLPENAGLCTMGGCEKGLANAPCGDATVDGKCGNNLERVCIGDRIYQAAAAKKDLASLTRILPPRIPALAHTSSIVNALFQRDHTKPNLLINIAEAIHASIPKTGLIMKELHALGPDAYTKDSGPLRYIRALIESQVEEGADYLAVNLDAFGERDPNLAVELMRQYTRLVRQWSHGVPICVDSSDNNVLAAGLKEWYHTQEPVRPPLLNSVKTYTADEILPLRKQYNFSIVGLLVTQDIPTGPGGSHSVEELYQLARQIFEKATAHDFKPGEIFFDSTVFPLAIDMPMDVNVPGYTYRAFETIKRIKADPKMKGVHCSLGLSNSVRDLPGRRVGVCRAYTAKAYEYGLDAGIVNTAHRYGHTEADPQLVEMVDAFAKMDGTPEKQDMAMAMMGKFCQDNKKASA
jgi:methylenetetrahydrofolate reductase (NADPH)